MNGRARGEGVCIDHSPHLPHSLTRTHARICQSYHPQITQITTTPPTPHTTPPQKIDTKFPVAAHAGAGGATRRRTICAGGGGEEGGRAGEPAADEGGAGEGKRVCRFLGTQEVEID